MPALVEKPPLKVVLCTVVPDKLEESAAAAGAAAPTTARTAATKRVAENFFIETPSFTCYAWICKSMQDVPDIVSVQSAAPRS